MATICDPWTLVESGEPLEVEPETIHVWLFGLQGSPECVRSCCARLSREEAARAGRFLAPTDRDRYILAHGVLRSLLARYERVDPRELRFGSGPANKPFLLRDSQRRFRLSFNLAHSGDRALLAIGAGPELGVDLEHVRQEIDALAIGKRFFFGAEFDHIASVPADERLDWFFRYWVAKEAVLKGQGVGLAFPFAAVACRGSAWRLCLKSGRSPPPS